MHEQLQTCRHWTFTMPSFEIIHHSQHHHLSQVSHSQRLIETPLSCWIIIERNGEVCWAHCNCMAGLGETCTHIAAVLFDLEASARIQGKQTCTQRKCEWTLTSDIDFTSAKGKMCKLDKCNSPNKGAISNPSQSTVTPSNTHYKSFYENVRKTGTKPLLSKYSDAYVRKSMLCTSLQLLPLLHTPEYIELDYPDLLKLCESQRHRSN